MGERFIAQEEKEIRELEDFVRRANQTSSTNHAIKRMGQERACVWRKNGADSTAVNGFITNHTVEINFL